MQPKPIIKTRRELVVAGSALLAGLAVTSPAQARLVSARSRLTAGKFLDGVASGEPSSDAVTFWGRISSEQSRAGAKLIVAKDPGMTQTVATVDVPTAPSMDNTLKARVGGLQPSTHYWYVWQSKTSVSPQGRTKTAPPADSSTPVVIGYSSCQNYPVGFFNAHGDAAAHDEIDLYAFLGDYTYEYSDQENDDPGQRIKRGEGDPASTELASYRSKLALYRRDAQLRELHRLHPVVHVWDDHEVADNYTDGDPAPSAMQRNAGYRASNEWLPRLAVPGDRFRLYRSLRYGKLAELFIVDERQYRDPGVPGTTILGRSQMDWLKGGLANSGARWKLVGNPDMLTPLGIAPNGETGIIVNKDQWDGYPRERSELLSWLSVKGISDVAFLTGDIHLYMANDVIHNGRPVATEYIGGSVTSTGLSASLSGVAVPVLRGVNPWIKFFDAAQHGWAIARVSADRLDVEYRVSDIRTSGAPSRTLAAFSQETGSNRVTQVVGRPEGTGSVRVLGEDPANKPAAPGSLLQKRRSRYEAASAKDQRRRNSFARGNQPNSRKRNSSSKAGNK